MGSIFGYHDQDVYIFQRLTLVRVLKKINLASSTVGKYIIKTLSPSPKNLEALSKYYTQTLLARFIDCK